MDVVFEWDERKNRKNQKKYGITFNEAKDVFLDPGRLVIRETAHNSEKPHWLCVGSIGEKIVKVRFTYQKSNIEILWSRILTKTEEVAPPSGMTSLNIPDENSSRLPGEMAEYEDDPFDLGEVIDEELIVVKDFLPRPEALVFRSKGIKVTLTLSAESIAYFIEQGKRLNTPYQNIIRNLIDEYVKQQQPWN